MARLGVTESVDTISIQTPKGRLPLTLRYQHIGWKKSVDIGSRIIKNFNVISNRDELNFFGNKAKLKFKLSCILGRLWFRTPETENFLLLESRESGASEPGIPFDKSGIALTIEILNPRSTNMESGIHRVEFRFNLRLSWITLRGAISYTCEL